MRGRLDRGISRKEREHGLFLLCDTAGSRASPGGGAGKDCSYGQRRARDG